MFGDALLPTVWLATKLKGCSKEGGGGGGGERSEESKKTPRGQYL